MPTGLFLTGSYGSREIDGNLTAGVVSPYTGPDVVNWHLSGGLNKNFFGIGNTVLFAEYSQTEGGLEQARFLGGNAANWSDTEFSHWGLGINQYVDAAAMQIFATYKSFEVDGNLTAGAVTTRQNAEFSTFLIGTRIDF